MVPAEHNAQAPCGSTDFTVSGNLAASQATNNDTGTPSIPNDFPNDNRFLIVE